MLICTANLTQMNVPPQASTMDLKIRFLYNKWQCDFG